MPSLRNSLDMALVCLGLGSNLNDRMNEIQLAGSWLAGSILGEMRKSSIYESEPIGVADQPFLNAVAAGVTSLEPYELLQRCKEHESRRRRDFSLPKWSNRPIDIDIIGYDDEIIRTDSLKIPHPEYANRLFVLYPLKEIFPDWSDPISRTPIQRLVQLAPEMSIKKTSFTW